MCSTRDHNFLKISEVSFYWEFPVLSVVPLAFWYEIYDFNSEYVVYLVVNPLTMTFTDNHFPPMKKWKFTVLFNWTFIACTGMTTSIKTFVHSAIEQ